nr:MAG TPA: hypothetical protein [Caudoviricetes sp.]
MVSARRVHGFHKVSPFFRVGRMPQSCLFLCFD